MRFQILKVLFFGFVAVVAFSGCADLIPAKPPNKDTLFCQRKSDGNVSYLLVYVKNQGSVYADSSHVEVKFYLGGSSVQVRSQDETGDLGPGQTSGPLRVKIPIGCFDPDCDFDIIVDVDDEVSEGNEQNNKAAGRCIG